jgi:diguanylate cyclase (GGDEF)-like protein/PAS domain S-box-containing protein
MSQHLLVVIADRGRRATGLLGALLVLLGLCLGAQSLPAAAVTVIPIGSDQDRIEITERGEFVEGRSDSVQIETAPGPDGVTSRMNVTASTPGYSPNWIVFALRNDSNRPVERWLTAERYSLINSGIVWPDLDARRLEQVTPSIGFFPDRIRSDRADIFRITLDPGQTITYAAELSSDRFARIYLWTPLEYELKASERQLFNGIMLGIIGVLGVFLTSVFAANHKAIFPTAALLTWCVLGYLCVDFGFWHKLFQLRPEDNAIYRAATESAVAASFLIFLHTFLRLGVWHSLIRMLLGVWIVAQLSLIAVAVIDARLAATFARASFAAIGGIGGLFILFLALRGQDRAMSLIPTWILFVIWIFAMSVTLTGKLSGDVVIYGLISGLMLVTLLLGFTVTQYAFRAVEPLYGALPSEQQLRSQAIEGAGAAVWEWLVRRDEIKVSPIVEASLGLHTGELSCKVPDFAAHMHQADRERFRLLLWSVQERNGGEIRIDFRMRHADGTHRWFDLEAASVAHSDRRALRCVGLMREITESKRAQERLMHDAVHDNLTGLPNRQLFLDRLGVIVSRAATDLNTTPAVLVVDVDKFKSVNASFGLVVGDSLLLTIARRLGRHLQPQDTLARLGGNQFAIMMLAPQEARELAGLAERIRRSLRAPIKIAGRDIVLTASIGIAIWDGQANSSEDLLKEAEVAMYRAKREGADRVEIFRPEFRTEVDDRVAVESDLHMAIERRQLKVLYQPIVYLPTEELAGFEALVRWEHPKLGLLNPTEFIPVAEESDLIVKLGSFVLGEAVAEAARWQRELPRTDRQLFVSVNISSRQLLRPGLVQEVRQAMGKSVLPLGALRLEVTESLVMENPERAIEVLEQLRSTGTGLSLDDFGTGYSSLSYLQRFPFDTIKIDRDLVQSGGAEGAGSAIVRSIVALGHEIGKKIVAEGVEASDDVSFLRSIGCEYGQGFFYGEPMPEKDAMQLVRMVRKSEKRLQRSGLFRMSAKRKRRRRGRPAPEITAAAPPPTPEAPLHETPPAPHRGPELRPTAGRPPRHTPPPNETGGPRPRPGGTTLPASTIRTRGRPQAPSDGLPPNVRRIASVLASLPQVPNSGNGRPPNASLSSRLRSAQATVPPKLPPSHSLNDIPPLSKGNGSTTFRPPPLPPFSPLSSAPAAPKHANGSGADTTTPATRPPTRPPNLSALPPAIAASLEKLGGSFAAGGSAHTAPEQPPPRDPDPTDGNGT